MRYFLLIIFSLSVLRVSGQNHFIGIKGGASWVNLKSDFSEYIQNQQFFNGGLTYDYRFMNGVNVSANIIFAQKGYSDEVIFVDASNETQYIVPIDNRFNYISFPVKAGYIIGEKFGGFLNVGLVPSILLKATFRVPRIAGISEAQEIEFTELASKFDLAGTIDLGFQYYLEKRTQIFIMASYQHGFININSSEELAYGKMKFSEILLSFGLKYNLTKN